jgi:hypothetical protein
MIRQHSAWITLNGVATTECQIMTSQKELKSSQADHPLDRLASNLR